MLCEVLERIVTQILRRARIPLTAKRISDALGGVVSVENITAVCLKLVAEGVLAKWGNEAYSVKFMSRLVPRNLLITEEYQALGMTLLRVAENTLVHYIPQEAEHRFFEVRRSTVSEKAGLGLFLRSSRALPQGAVICEYVGRMLHPPAEENQSECLHCEAAKCARLRGWRGRERRASLVSDFHQRQRACCRQC
ncbi:hypothetical protein C3747_103g75 [Trypanosoma cruzi]|uniref:Uncharacterized protein n=1 Tax=Trypanosoma cruzi TaxID=5693 RepID=A0A2V2WFC1_TRYCR|nr:hypothetical protein C3747_103g75 [Trypanosoma cruzi]